MSCFADFKFEGTLFSKIMLNFCRPHAMSIHEMQQFSLIPFIFFKNQANFVTAYYKLHNPTDINV